MGGCAIDAFGKSLPPDSSLETCLKAATACCWAPWAAPSGTISPPPTGPRRALAGACGAAMGLYANLRPARLLSAAGRRLPPEARTSPPEGIDFDGGPGADRRRLLRRARARKTADGEQKATDIMAYSEHEIAARRPHVAFQMARKRRKRVTSVDKANVLDTSRLWRRVVHRGGRGIPGCGAAATCMVDNAAMQIVRDPSQFDVIVTENLFGDILSDEASHDHRLHRHDPLLQHGRGHPGPVRAHPRLRPGHCRARTRPTPSAPFWPPP